MRRFTSFGLVGMIALALLISSAPAEQSATPTKEQGIAVLKKLLAALEAKDYDAALALMYLPPDTTAEQKAEWKASLAGLLDKKELSAAGIEKLAANGKWGTLVEVFGQERAARMAGKFKAPLENCYGLSLDDAEAGFVLADGSLKVIRCDDIGKLE